MPNHRVGVSLNLRENYGTRFRSATAQTEHFRGALERTAGAAQRVGAASRRMADTASAAIDRTRRKVDGLIGRFRALERTGRAAGGALGGGQSAGQGQLQV